MSITLNPCPFCEGPPNVSAFDDITGVMVYAGHRRKEDEGYNAYVWCHDCGCQGPNQNSTSISIFEGRQLTVGQLLHRAVVQWNSRHSQARELYDASLVDGLCQYPRKVVTS